MANVTISWVCHSPHSSATSTYTKTQNVTTNSAYIICGSTYTPQQVFGSVNSTESGCITNWQYYTSSAFTTELTSFKCSPSGTIGIVYSCNSKWYMASSGSNTYDGAYTASSGDNPWCVHYFTNAPVTTRDLYARRYVSYRNYSYVNNVKVTIPSRNNYYSHSLVKTTGNTIWAWKGDPNNKGFDGNGYYNMYYMYPYADNGAAYESSKNHQGNYRFYPMLVPNIYQVNLNHQGATTNAKRSDGNDLNELWEKFGICWGHSSALNTTYTSITIPKKTGYTFGGYYTGTNGTGTQMIKADGTLPSNKSVTNESGATVTEIIKYIDNSGNIYDSAADGRTKVLYSKSVANSATWYAYWIADTIKITANSNGGSISATTGWTGSGTSASKNITAGSRIGTLPTLAARRDYTFVGWNTSSTATTSNVSTATMFNSTTVIYAIWKKSTVTVTADGNGGTISTTSPSWTSKTMTIGAKIGTLPTVTRTKYTLKGWYDAKTGGNQVTSTSTVPSTDPYIIYAQWNKSATTVTANSNGGTIPTTSGWTGSGTSASKDVTLNATIGTLPTPTRTNYAFTGWYTATTGGDEVKSATKIISSMSDPYNIYAQWINGFKINLKNGSTTVATLSMILNSTNNNNITNISGRIPISTTQVFTGWYTSDDTLVYSYNNNNTVTAVTGNNYFDSSGKWIYNKDLDLYAGWRTSYCWAYNSGWKPVRNVWVYNGSSWVRSKGFQGFNGTSWRDQRNV